MQPQRSLLNSFTLALGDTLSPRVLLVSLLSFVLTLLFFFAMIWLSFGGIGALSVWLGEWLQGFEGNFEQTWLFSLISLFVIAKTVVGILFFITSMLVVYYLFLMVYSIIVGLFAGYFIQEIGKTYYPNVHMRAMALFSYLGFVAKTLLITGILLILLLPLALIPVFNFILLVPVFYMFHKLLVLDVASLLNSKEEYLRLKGRYAASMRGISLVCFALTLIPVFGVLIYPYYVIVMSHFIFQKTQEIRAL